MSRVFIRFAIARDAARLVAEGVLAGSPPPGETWEARVERWLDEQHAGRRVILIAEDHSGLLGTAQLIFRFPEGYADPEAANGEDIAMIEMLRLRPNAPAAIANQLLADAQNIARKRRIRTLTFCLSLANTRAVQQVRDWGFAQFRVMPDRDKMLGFFRKAI